MDFYMKLPRNKREFALFLFLISIISVNLIAPLITCMELGFSLRNWAHTISVFPILYPCVVACVLLTHMPASLLARRVVDKDDSFRAQMLASALCGVLLLSPILTVVGSWIGMGAVSLSPFETFFFKWPRNFAVAFAVEFLIAQPAARFVMLHFHAFLDAHQAEPQVAYGSENE